MAEKYLTRTIKTTLIAVFTFQLLSTVERQVFDFLGYMWAPIIGNFFQIIAVILGLFGACQRYRSFVVVYAVWSLLWLGWNIFVICLYLEVGILNRNNGRYILTIGTESKSWWLEHGIGCNITNSSWRTQHQDPSDTGRPLPPEEYVEGCILQYYYVEVIHAAVQVLLALVGLVVAFLIIYTSLEDQETSVAANNELQFVMMRNRPLHTTTITSNNNTHTHTNDFHNLAFHSDNNISTMNGNNFHARDFDNNNTHTNYFHSRTSDNSPTHSNNIHAQTLDDNVTRAINLHTRVFDDAATHSNNFHTQDFHADNDGESSSLHRSYHRPPPPRLQPYELPPSYDSSVRNIDSQSERRAADEFYSSGRQSSRSRSSTRSKRRSGRSRGDQQAGGSGRSRRRDRFVDHVRQDLPWVKVAPSLSGSAV